MHKREIIVYGGAFNPPTIAHQTILEKCVEYAELHSYDICILPSGNRTDKSINTPRETRLAYIEAMIYDTLEHDVRIQVLTSELDRTIDVETYDTIVELEQLHPDCNFTWVYGADSTQTMPQWKNGNWILENTKILVVQRPGSEINPNAKHVNVLEIPNLDVSSTELRNRIQNGQPFEDLVSPSIYELLTK